MSYYWEILDKQVGEIKQYGIPFDHEVEAIEHAKNFIREEGRPGTYTIKLFTQSPDERWPATSNGCPVSSEEFFLESPPDSLRRPGELIDHPERQEVKYGWYMIDRQSNESAFSSPIYGSVEDALSEVRIEVERKYNVFYWDQPGWAASGVYVASSDFVPRSVEDIKPHVVLFNIY